MTRVTVLTVGARGATPGLAAAIVDLSALAGVELTAITLYPCAPLTDNGVASRVLVPQGQPARRSSLTARAWRYATLRADRWQLWARLRRSREALELIEHADIVMVDGPGAVYAGWRAARRFPHPWVLVGPLAVRTLVANRYRDA